MRLVRTFGVLVSGHSKMNEANAERFHMTTSSAWQVDVVAAYVSKNQLPAGQIPDVIHTVFNSLNQLDNQAPEVKAEAPRPACTTEKVGYAGLHRLPGRWQKVEDVEAPSSHHLRHDA